MADDEEDAEGMEGFNVCLISHGGDAVRVDRGEAVSNCIESCAALAEAGVVDEVAVAGLYPLLRCGVAPKRVPNPTFARCALLLL